MKTLYLTLLTLFCISYSFAQKAGELDKSFNPDDIGYGNGADNYVVFTQTLADGKILLGGQFYSYKGKKANGLVRILEDGTLDPTFVIDTVESIDPKYIYYIKVLPNNKILIGGSIINYLGRNINHLTRLNSDGSLDTTFNSPQINSWVNSISTQHDGKILVTHGDNTKIYRLLENGSLDSSFNIGIGPDENAYFAIQQTDHKIIINGVFNNFNGTPCYGLVRLLEDGGIDTSFKFTYINKYQNTILVKNNNQIIISGTFDTVGTSARNGIALINANGSLDLNYNPGQYLYSNSRIGYISNQQNGKLLVAGQLEFANIEQKLVARFNIDGSLDTNFMKSIPSYKGDDISYFIEETQNQKIIFAGSFKTYNHKRVGNFTRIQEDGTLDYTFNKETGVGGSVYSIQKLNNNKLLIAGEFGSYNENDSIQNIARINADGRLDNTFRANVDGKIIKTLIQADGKIIIIGEFRTVSNEPKIGIARLNTSGSLDQSFNINNVGANGIVNSIVKTSNGQYYIMGEFTQFNNINVNGLIRLTANGSLDQSFVFKLFTGKLRSMALDSADNIYVAGISKYNNYTTKAIIRLNANAELDTNYTKNQVPNFTWPSIRNIFIYKNNTLLYLGSKNATSPGIYLYNYDGTPNSSFNNNLKLVTTSLFHEAHLVNNNKVLISGSFTKFNLLFYKNLVRINIDGTIDTTFNAGQANNSIIRAIIEDDNKNYLLGGDFTKFNDIGKNGIVRIFGEAKPMLIQASKLKEFIPYPNPVRNTIWVSSNENTVAGSGYWVEVFDMFGKLVLSTETRDGQVDIRSLVDGVYLIKFGDQIARFIVGDR